uniref:Methyltransferase n=1 Tax=viral metagenome TaxID=1070528 RepID=A0A6C0F317_9ZZZZ
MDLVNQKFIQLSNIPSDINEHLPTLEKYARECETILELGVRGVTSSWAFSHGLLNNNKPNKKLIMNDIDECNILELLYKTANTDLKINYYWINDLALDLDDKVDLTFIDTWHVYAQLKRELAKFSKITKKYIIMHDTTVDEWLGESIRNGWNAYDQSIQSGFLLNEINKGLWPAIEEFLHDNTNWKLRERFTNNNGLTILERI